MAEDLSKQIESGLKNNRTLAEVKQDLVSQGYLEQDIDSAAKILSGKISKTSSDIQTIKLLDRKLMLDRISYGFGSNQIINILFTFTGANLFLIGLINALKSGIVTILSGLVTEYTKKNTLSNKFIMVSGLLFGFSFIVLSTGVALRNKTLFATGLLLGSIGVVVYGESFRNMMIKKLGGMSFSVMMARFTVIGIIITALSLVLSALIIDAFPLSGVMFHLTLPTGHILPYKVHGYLIAFLITAVASILSAHFMSKIKHDNKKEDKPGLLDFISFYFKERISEKIRIFISNKYLVVIGLATLGVAVFQSIINSYIGIFIYVTYAENFFQGFMNIGMLFAVALLLSVLGPIAAAKLNKYLGLAPMFVFGALIMTIMPLTIVYSPEQPPFYPALLVAAALSLIGAGIIGSGQSILISRLLNSEERQTFYESNGLIMLVPFLVVTITISWYAYKLGIVGIFKYLSIGAIAFLLPIYMILVIWSTKKKL